jgi:hypothetical protein
MCAAVCNTEKKTIAQATCSDDQLVLQLMEKDGKLTVELDVLVERND